MLHSEPQLSTTVCPLLWIVMNSAVPLPPEKLKRRLPTNGRSARAWVLSVTPFGCWLCAASHIFSSRASIMISGCGCPFISNASTLNSSPWIHIWSRPRTGLSPYVNVPLTLTNLRPSAALPADHSGSLKKLSACCSKVTPGQLSSSPLFTVSSSSLLNIPA